MKRAFLALALAWTVALARASPSPFAKDCVETPTTSKIVNGQALWGKADGVGIGVEWGTNFEFPDAGCWELSVSAPLNAPAKIVVRVAKS